MASTVPCTNPAHGVKSHIIGTAAATECASGRGSEGATRSSTIPAMSHATSTGNRSGVRGRTGKNFNAYPRMSWTEIERDRRRDLSALKSDLADNPHIESKRKAFTGSKSDSSGTTVYSYDGIPFLTASTRNGIAVLPQVYGGKAYPDAVWELVRHISDEHPDHFALRNGEAEMGSSSKGFQDGYTGPRSVEIDGWGELRFDGQGRIENAEGFASIYWQHGQSRSQTDEHNWQSR